jgi:hypothetical protein
VGFNPATPLAADFWTFWRSDHGFDRKDWFEEYKRERRARPLKPGKTRRSSVSNTRRVIDWVTEEASPVQCLETNIYSKPTEQASDLVSRQRATAPFDFLLATIKPRVIVTHGIDAAEHIRRKTSSAHVLTVSHFSRGWSQTDARSLGQQIKRACEMPSTEGGVKSVLNKMMAR